MVLATSRIRNHRQMARARSRNGQRAIDGVRAAYDEAPYESYAHPQSAPGQLAAIAWAFGLDPPDVPRSRVLEIGCVLDGGRDRQALVDALMDIVGQDLIRIDRDDGLALDEEGIRDVLTQQIDAMPQRLTKMKLMSACDHASVIDHRRRA